jgi:hypothetical protein
MRLRLRLVEEFWSTMFDGVAKSFGGLTGRWLRWGVGAASGIAPDTGGRRCLQKVTGRRIGVQEYGRGAGTIRFFPSDFPWAH